MMIESLVFLLLFLTVCAIGLFVLSGINREWSAISTAFILSIVCFGLGLVDTVNYYDRIAPTDKIIKEMHYDAQFNIRCADTPEQARSHEGALQAALEKYSSLKNKVLSEENKKPNNYLIPGPFCVVILCAGIAGFIVSLISIIRCWDKINQK